MGIEVSPMPGGIPAGAMFIWLTDTAPAGWLLCYGQAISRTIYSALFAVIGTTFGVGDGSTTFNLPDLRGRTPLGQDNMGGASANRVTNAQADSIGGSAGTENHTLTVGQIPSHVHGIGTTSSTGAPRPTTSPDATSNPVNTGSTGGGGAHNNVQPYLTTNYIVKY